MSIELNTAVPKVVDEVQKNRTEIKALKSAIESGMEVKDYTKGVNSESSLYGKINHGDYVLVNVKMNDIYNTGHPHTTHMLAKCSYKSGGTAKFIGITEDAYGNVVSVLAPILLSNTAYQATLTLNGTVSTLTTDEPKYGYDAVNMTYANNHYSKKDLSNVSNTDFAAKATAAGVGSSGGNKSWKNITLTFATRILTINDLGKHIMFEDEDGNKFNGTVVVKSINYDGTASYTFEGRSIGTDSMKFGQFITRNKLWVTVLTTSYVRYEEKNIVDFYIYE